MRTFTTLMALALSIGSASAIPAMRGIRTMEQPDGSFISIKVFGDENMHFTTTEDGRILQVDEFGFYKIARISPDGAVYPTAFSPQEPESYRYATYIEDIDPEDIMAKRKAIRKAPQSGIGMGGDAYPCFGATKSLIVLVEYSDVKFNDSYDACDYFNDMINGKNFTQFGGTGSAYEYFCDQSAGQFTPDFHVLGPVTLPETQKYYGGNDPWGNETNAHKMVTDAIEILDAENPELDFSIYDTDGDGLIDNVFLFFAGRGEATYGGPDTVWPHAWDVRYGGTQLEVDGVMVSRYACSNEWDWDKPNGVGTFIHEFSHVMGLPDLYNTQQSYAPYTPGSYSVLDYGPYNNDGRTPPNYGAYEKNALGWFEPTVLETPGSMELEEITSGQFALIPTSKNTEFFLLENRQKTGWDRYIPFHGMLIWHIDYDPDVFFYNTVNNRRNHQHVDIIEANDIQDAQYRIGFTYPGRTQNTSFTPMSKPALKTWEDEEMNIGIVNIAEQSKKIYFDVITEGFENYIVDSAVDVLFDDESSPLYYNLQGLKVDKPAKGELVIEKRGREVRKLRF